MNEDGPWELHVCPIGDAVHHDADDGCVCGPTPEFVEGGVIVQHHSLDGRELAEP